MYGIMEKFYGFTIGDGTNGYDHNCDFVKAVESWMSTRVCTCATDPDCSVCWWASDKDEYIFYAFSETGDEGFNHSRVGFHTSYTGDGTSPLAFGVHISGAATFDAKEMRELFTQNNTVDQALLDKYKAALEMLDKYFPGLRTEVEKFQPGFCYYRSTS